MTFFVRNIVTYLQLSLNQEGHYQKYNQRKLLQYVPDIIIHVLSFNAQVVTISV